MDPGSVPFDERRYVATVTSCGASSPCRHRFSSASHRRFARCCDRVRCELEQLLHRPSSTVVGGWFPTRLTLRAREQRLQHWHLVQAERDHGWLHGRTHSLHVGLCWKRVADVESFDVCAMLDAHPWHVVGTLRATARLMRSVQMKIALRVLAGSGALLGAFAAGFAITQAVNPGPPVSDSELSVEVTHEGIPAKAFSARVAIADEGGGTVHLSEAVVRVDARKSIDDDVCYTAQRVESTEQGCYNADVLARGLAYASSSDRPGDFVTVGFVPDGVDRIVMNGVDVEFKSNVWSYAGPPPGEGSSMELFDASGALVVSISADTFSSVVPGTLPRRDD